jgi:hypothetical protein
MVQYYVPYVRTSNGTIHRLPESIFSLDEDPLHAYIYEEIIAGWPEPKVYWETSDGLSPGLAPLACFRP